MSGDAVPPGCAVVVCYHGVAERVADPDVQTVQTEAASFAAQLDHLARRYEMVSPTALPEVLRGAGGAPKAAVTFDDGYRNVLEVAAPLLKARGIPFAVFVSTRHVATGERFPPYVLRAALHHAAGSEAWLPGAGMRLPLGSPEARRAAVAALLPVLKRAPQPRVRALLRELRALLPPDAWEAVDARCADDAPLDWAGVRALADAGAEIGAHGHEHAILHDAQRPAEVVRQLRASRRAVEARVGPCPAFAYPNGGTADVGRAAARLLPACGYRLGFTAVRGVVAADTTPHLLPRVFAPAAAEALPGRIADAARADDAYRAWAAALASPPPSPT